MNKFIGAIVVVLVSLGVFAVFSRSGDKEGSSPFVGFAPKGIAAESDASAVGQTVSQEIVAGFKSQPDQSESGMSSEIEEESLSKFLLESNQLTEKVLKTAEEIEFQRRVLASPKMLAYIFKSLDEEMNYKNRMQAVEFLAESIRWKSNPIREQVLERAFEFISSDRLKNISDIEDRKMRAADHIEVMLTLMREEPDRFEQYAAGIQSEVNQKLIKFTKELYGKGRGGS